ncbi:MAG: hypothetical protein IJC48_03420 [Clostridia bacterium]|nr:hypothetical protein [Clostridia bacterium]MBQ4157547.1 hypothetical protein [Clostridia bacterium]
MITFTFLVFNIMLAPARKAYLNYRINSVLFHIVLPLMFIADWVLFYEKPTIRWFGYFMVKKMMDSVTYENVNGINCLTLSVNIQNAGV